MKSVLIFLLYACNFYASAQFMFSTPEKHDQVGYQYKVEKWLNTVDSNLSDFNLLAGHLTWKLSTDSDEKTAEQARQLSIVRNRWRNKVCESNIKKKWITQEQRRKIYLLCRGPKFTDDLILEYFQVMGELSGEYNAKVCLSENFDFEQAGLCLNGEPDLERLMQRQDLSPEQLKWIWLSWHDDVGPRIKPLFQRSVEIQNKAARNNGYNDIGEVWREELEMQDLEKTAFELYEEVSSLYVLLHAVIRHNLLEKYGAEQIDKKGAIPVHLLGNMWGQDWSSLAHTFPFFNKNNIDLNANLRKKNISVKDMVLEAEDFYTSLSLPKMTKKFWKHSIFEQSSNTSLCHGTAANLYNSGDFRMIMCGKTTMEDFYVIHHEMGHIEYYMAYEEQPSVFQEGTNTAFHESIGDAIMHAVMTPQHLRRLNLLNDAQLLDESTELNLLFQQALSKLPELSFALIIDKFRWDIFRGEIPPNKWNEHFWKLSKKYRGVVPPGPEERNSFEYFDAGGKFHIPDNTPYIRYFLSGILQMQLFKSLCEISMYGSGDYENLGELPLQRCDIYGSKTAGKRLLCVGDKAGICNQAVMEKGASIHWSEALQMICGSGKVSTEPFLEYYKPFYKWLARYVEINNVYVGW